MKRGVCVLVGVAGLMLVPVAAQAAGVSAAWSPQTSPGAYDFGLVAVGQTRAQTFHLTNTGKAKTPPLRITFSGSSAFTKMRDTCRGETLAHGQSCLVRISYRPTTDGQTDTATLAAHNQSLKATYASIVLSATASSCVVTNGSTHATYSTLQAANDGATDGDMLTVQGTCTGPTYLTKNLDIVGAGTAPTLKGDGTARVLGILGSSQVVTISSLTITGGNASQGSGGGIFNFGDLTLTDVSVTKNSADFSGGGVDNEGGTLLVNGTSLISGNSAGSFGEGIQSDGGTVTLADSTGVTLNTGSAEGGGVSGLNGAVVTLSGHAAISQNFGLDGGGVSLTRATLVAGDQSSITDNGASGNGGGIASQNNNNGTGTITLNDNVTVSGNTNANGDGGGIAEFGTPITVNGAVSIDHNSTSGNGGGVALILGSLTLNDTSIITLNHAAGVGGGVSNNGGTVTLNGGTVTANTPDDCNGC